MLEIVTLGHMTKLNSLIGYIPVYCNFDYLVESRQPMHDVCDGGMPYNHVTVLAILVTSVAPMPNSQGFNQWRYKN